MKFQTDSEFEKPSTAKFEINIPQALLQVQNKLMGDAAQRFERNEREKEIRFIGICGGITVAIAHFVFDIIIHVGPKVGFNYVRVGLEVGAAFLGFLIGRLIVWLIARFK